MNDIVKREFARLTPEPGPPTAITADGLVAGGRRRRARRIVAAISGTTSTVAVVAAVTVLLSSGLPGGDPMPDEDRQAGDPPWAQARYDLPDLDPDKQYEYGMYDETTETDITERLTKAFMEFMEDSEIDAAVAITDQDKPKTVELDGKYQPRIMRQEEGLFEIPCADADCEPDPEAESLLDRPTYQLMVKEGGSWGTDAQLVFGDRDFSETLNMGFYPAGSFIAEPYDTAKQPWFSGHKHDPYLADGCSDLDYEGHGTKQHRRYDCDWESNPGGGDFKVLTIERTMTRDDAPDHVAYRYTVVVIDDVGGAIRVTLDSPGAATCNGCGSPGDDPPSMSMKALTNLAQYMPPLRIE